MQQPAPRATKRSRTGHTEQLEVQLKAEAQEPGRTGRSCRRTGWSRPPEEIKRREDRLAAMAAAKRKIAARAEERYQR